MSLKKVSFAHELLQSVSIYFVFVLLLVHVVITFTSSRLQDGIRGPIWGAEGPCGRQRCRVGPCGEGRQASKPTG